MKKIKTFVPALVNILFIITKLIANAVFGIKTAKKPKQKSTAFVKSKLNVMIRRPAIREVI